MGTLVFWALYTLFAVVCHRIVLLGSASVPEYGMFQIGRRDLLFAGGLIKIAIISILAIICGVMILQLPVLVLGKLFVGKADSRWLGEYLPFIAYLIQVYMLARLGLILPAIAVDKSPSLKWAWQVSRGNGLRLMLMLGLLPWLLQLPSYFFPEDVGIWGRAVYYLMWWLLLPIEITILSLSYKELAKDS
jgi:hypothetical protein